MVNDWKAPFLRWPHTVITAALGLVLFPPLLLIVVKGAAFEPYPALILPGGPDVVSLDAEAFTYQQVFLFARRNGGAKPEAVVINDVFPRLRATRIQALMRKNFGLHHSDTVTDRDREVHRWLRERLAAGGFATDSVSIQVRQLLVHLEDGDLLSDSIVRQTIIPLD